MCGWVDGVSCLWQNRGLILLRLALRRVSLVIFHATLSFLRVRPRSLQLGQSMMLPNWHTTVVRYGLRAVVDCAHLVAWLRSKDARMVGNFVDRVMREHGELLLIPCRC